MNAIKRYWMEKSHNVIQSSYEKAILHYNNQKNNLLELIKKETNEGVEDFIKDINDSIEKEIPEELEKTFDKAYEGVKDFFNNYILTFMTEDNINYKDLMAQYERLIKKEKKGTVNPKNSYNNLIKSIEKFLGIKNTGDKSELQKILAEYVSKYSGLEYTNNKDIQSNLFGYMRKLIFAKLKNSKDVDTKHLKTSLKGYYKEHLLVPVFENALKELGYAVRQTGSISENGQEIKYDLIYGTSDIKNITNEELAKLIKKLDSIGTVKATASVEMYEPKVVLAGIQSKSWVLPWSTRSKGGNRNFLSFGHSAHLLPTGVNIYYWHAGLYQVMTNLPEVIGKNNAIFSTGDTIFWTSDLLTELKAKQYVLAFYYGKKKQKLSSEVVAMPHND